MPRGGGTSQCGQTVNESLVVDCSKHLNRILDLDVAGRRCVVEPGIVLDDLNRAAQAARAVVSGRYLDRLARHHRRHGRQQFLRRPLAALRQHARERAVDRCGAGRRHAGAFRPGGGDLSDCRRSPLRPLARDLLALGAREADEIEARFPKVQRRVGGYNLDALGAGQATTSISRISWSARKGTLAFSTAIELKLSPLLGRRAVGACHFGWFHEAMDAAQHIVQARSRSRSNWSTAP